MAWDDIREHVYQGTDGVFDWVLKDDADESGVQAAIDADLTRVVAVCRNVDTGATVTLDTDGAVVDLGSTDEFRWSQPTATLSLAWGALIPGTLAAGEYQVELTVYDATRPNGIRFGREGQLRRVVCHASS